MPENSPMKAEKSLLKDCEINYPNGKRYYRNFEIQYFIPNDGSSTRKYSRWHRQSTACNFPLTALIKWRLRQGFSTSNQKIQGEGQHGKTQKQYQ